MSYLNTKELDQLTETVCQYADKVGLDTGNNDDDYIFVSDAVGELMESIYKRVKQDTE